MKQNSFRLLLIFLFVLPLVMLAKNARFRIDLTEENLFSLSLATKELIESLDDRLQIKLYFSRDIEGHEYLLPQRQLLEGLLGEIEALGGEYVSVETVDPTSDLVAHRDAEHIGVEPVPLTGKDIGSLSLDMLYQGLEMRYQDRSETIPFLIASDFEFAFSARLANLLRGSKPRLLFVTNEPPLPPQIPGFPSQVPEERFFEELRRVLGTRFIVEDSAIQSSLPLDLEGVSAIVMPRPVAPSDIVMKGVKEYLEGGGSVLVLLDKALVDPTTLNSQFVDTGLDVWLSDYGIGVDDRILFDSNSITVQAGVHQVETSEGTKLMPLQAPYGFGVIAEGKGLNVTHPITSALGSVVLFWAHSLEVSRVRQDLQYENLIMSSEQSWLLPGDSNLSMNSENIRQLQLAAYRSESPKSYPLAVAISGTFLDESKPGRLIVVGDSDLFHNVTLRGGGDANSEFASNMVDWLANDINLISLRSRGQRPRPLFDYAAEYLKNHGGLGEDEDANRELAKDAISFAANQQRLFAWFHVLLPFSLMFILGLMHYINRTRQERKSYVE